MRHAKSSWRDGEQDDHERPLNGRGRRAAPFMGDLLAKQGLRPDFIITSTALRALETAKSVALAAGYGGSLEVTRSLYLAEPSVYRQSLLDVPEGRERVLLVGHNPGISEFLFALTGVERDMPTASIAQVALGLSEFSAVTAETRGELVQFWRPREEQKDEKKSRS
jgi:phosphohistidine phosphatase